MGEVNSYSHEANANDLTSPLTKKKIKKSRVARILQGDK